MLKYVKDGLVKYPRTAEQIEAIEAAGWLPEGSSEVEAEVEAEVE